MMLARGAGVDRPSGPGAVSPFLVHVRGSLVEVAGDKVDGGRFSGPAHSDVSQFPSAAVGQVPLEIISATLRHAGLSITKDIYVAYRPKVERPI
jgi:hypothetical protein